MSCHQQVRLPVITLVLLSAASCGSSNTSALREVWNSWNDPLIMLSSDYKREFAALPLTGRIDVTPWSDTYWPSFLGGIANHWATAQANQYPQVAVLDARMIGQLNQQQMAGLSPAEKYDLLRMDYSFTLTQSEFARAKPTAPQWEGLCHGWSPASLQFTSPKPVTVTNGNGFVIPFGSSDVKALLTYMSAMVRGGEKQLGQRCNIDLTTYPAAGLSPECRDVNAGAFHLVLTNELALAKRGFVMDRMRDAEVWNQPVFGFKSTVLSESSSPSPGAAPGTVKEVSLQTTVDYAVETNPTWEAKEPITRSSTYQYRLEIDAQGQVIGGEWLNEGRPDFLWSKPALAFTGSYEALGWLYSQATK